MAQSNDPKLSKHSGSHFEPLPLIYDEIKAVLDVYNIIFHTFTLYQPLASVSDIKTTQPSPSTMSPTVYTLHKDAYRRFSRGISSLPPRTSEVVIKAYLKKDLCDFALETMLRPICTRLRTVGARVDWLIVSPAPQLLLHFEDEKVETPAHSVLSVTCRNGEQYIADFTIEQFGYPSAAWFMAQNDYLEGCTTDGMWELAGDEVLGDLGVDLRTEVESQSTSKKWHAAVREVCYALNWDGIDILEKEERMDVVRRRAEEVFLVIVDEYGE
jgi:hypothetical protein